MWTSGSFAGECAEEARTSCGTQRSIPDAHLDALTVRYDAANSRTYERGTGVPNSDLVLYVTASDEAGVCTDGVALAFADACERDQKDRPVRAQPCRRAALMSGRASAALKSGGEGGRIEEDMGGNGEGGRRGECENAKEGGLMVGGVRAGRRA